MEIMDYIKPELLVLIPVLYLIGAAIKKSAAKDKWIPLILGSCGVLLAAIYTLATSNMSGFRDGLTAVFVAVTQGILCAGASVYANQLIKQTSKDSDTDG